MPKLERPDFVSEKNLKSIIEEVRKMPYVEDYDVVGVRVVDPEYADYNAQIGDVLGPSHVWEDGVPTNEMLSGTSAIGVDRGYMLSATDNRGYYGNRVLVVGGDVSEGGNDIGEVIIMDAVVLDVIDLI